MEFKHITEYGKGRIVYVFAVTCELEVILQCVQCEEREHYTDAWQDAVDINNYDIRNDSVYTHNPIPTISIPVMKFIKHSICESINFRLKQQVKG